MKLKKILALTIALVSVLTLLSGCTMGNNPSESTPVETPSNMVLTTAKAHLSVVDVEGNVVYSTEEEDEEMYEYSSAYYKPTVINFFEDYCFINDKKIEYKADRNNANIIKTITIKTKKGDVNYKADDKYYVTDDHYEITFWVCLVNGVEIDSLAETEVKDGDNIVFRLTYAGQNIAETTRPEYVENNPS